MGRFMSPDWADKPEAVPYSSLSDPQTLNLYGYMRNNPLGGTDPDGHWPSWQQIKDTARSVGVGAAKSIYNSAATNPNIPNAAKEAGLGMSITGSQTLAQPNGAAETVGYYGTPVVAAAAGIVTDAAFLASSAGDVLSSVLALWWPPSEAVATGSKARCLRHRVAGDTSPLQATVNGFVAQGTMLQGT
jgi:hypothetical protein